MKPVLNRIVVISVTLVIACQLSAQKNEFGLFLGGSYYMGELNPNSHFSGVTNPAFGVYHDAHINARYTWRTIFTYGKLTADDHLTNIGLNRFRDLQFESPVYDISGQIHFNFFPYGSTMMEKPYTPYIFVGVSIFHVQPHVSSLNSDSASTSWPSEDYTRTLTSVAFPFGLGFKAMIGTLTLGIEWNFRKTWTDGIDGIDNQYDVGNVNGEPVNYNQPLGFQKGSFNTNDWYSFAGITLSYRPRPKKNKCPE